MINGYVRAAAATNTIKIANCFYNRQQIEMLVSQADERRCDLIVFPELSLTGYTCGDLFLTETLLSDAQKQLVILLENTKTVDMVIVVGLPIRKGSDLYNCAAVLYKGNILGIIPKHNIPNYGEYYEKRYFTEYKGGLSYITLETFSSIPFGDMIFEASGTKGAFEIGVEICEDLWVIDKPSNELAQNGATLICNLSASNELIGKGAYRSKLVTTQSGVLLAAYIYADAGEGESTSDVVFAGHKIIAENGNILADSGAFGADLLIADIDTEILMHERLKTGTFYSKNTIQHILFEHKLRERTDIIRNIEMLPFVPGQQAERQERCQMILDMQAHALYKRLSHTGCKHAVIGISGGLDSTLALLATVAAYKLGAMPTNDIICITMPCFGTSERTYQNALSLCRELNVTLREIVIKDAVMQHFKDIDHDISVRNVTYENAQARERTQVLMDVANDVGGIVVGTGDLSELALGWSTYNGDHMSMYAVNASIPKTLVRYVVEYYASKCTPVLQATLLDILNTPVSPELLPPDKDQIAQKTEEIVGPYDLHDFFLYYFCRYGFAPVKIKQLAQYAFGAKYTADQISKWFAVFIRRFFTQQFKRSCSPDGPKIGSVALSPRGDLRMPSDADFTRWLE